MMMSLLRDLPEDILILILLRIPAKYLLPLKFVCKYWFHLISDPRFVKTHLINVQASNKCSMVMTSRWSSCDPFKPLNCCLDDEKDSDHHPVSDVHSKQPQMTLSSFKIFWGSCNGLLCMELGIIRKDGSTNHIMCLWNPCTKEFKPLPDRPYKFPSSSSGWNMTSKNYGFGFGTDDDYKVIRNICFYGKQKRHILVEVYTLGTDSWKTIGNYPYEVSYDTGLFVSNNSIGGGVYWLASRYTTTTSTTTDIDDTDATIIIICFDIAKEGYREIPNPPLSVNPIETTVSPQEYFRLVYMSGNVKLAELNGFLCIVHAITELKCLEVWAMNKEGEELNWSKLFTIKEPIIALSCNQIQYTFELLGNFKNNNGDEILVLVDNKDLALYTPKNDKTRLLIQMGGVYSVQTYIESLVSLNSGSYTCH